MSGWNGGEAWLVCMNPCRLTFQIDPANILDLQLYAVWDRRKAALASQAQAVYDGFLLGDLKNFQPFAQQWLLFVEA